MNKLDSTHILLKEALELAENQGKLTKQMEETKFLLDGKTLLQSNIAQLEKAMQDPNYKPPKFPSWIVYPDGTIVVKHLPGGM